MARPHRVYDVKDPGGESKDPHIEDQNLKLSDGRVVAISLHARQGAVSAR